MQEELAGARGRARAAQQGAREEREAIGALVGTRYRELVGERGEMRGRVGALQAEVDRLLQQVEGYRARLGGRTETAVAVAPATNVGELARQVWELQRQLQAERRAQLSEVGCPCI